MFLSMLNFVLLQCFGSGVKFPSEKIFYISLVMLFTEVFILRELCMKLVQFFIDFMALDTSECSEETRIVKDDDFKNDTSNCEDKSDCEVDEFSDTEEDEISDCEEIPHLICHKTEEVLNKNENILWLEIENAKKALMVEQLRKKVDDMTKNGIQMEQNLKALERLSQQKNNQISSMAAEMETMKNEITQKAKETEKLVKENEDKDSTIMILESTISVLEMEKETLHHDLKEMEEDRHATEVQLRRLNDDLKGLREENKRTQNRFESLQKENVDKTSRIIGLQDQLEVLAIQKRRAEENLQQLAECQAEIAQSKNELENLKAQNLLKDREILRLENENSLKQKEVIGLLKRIKIAEAEKANENLNAMTKRTVRLEFELADTKEELETIEFEKMEAIVEIERLQQENLDKDTKIRSLEAKLSVLKEKKENETLMERNLITKEMLKRKRNVVKLETILEESVPERKVEKKRALDKTRCLRKPQIDCKALYRRLDAIEEGLNEMRASEQHSAATKRPSNRDELHQKMRLESAARLRKLEQESKFVKNLYKINSVT
ncbi:early endosome antigen 1-like [Macrobrachium rosenbergii]|uniref:early endosome antigen 1-like n=1 Tax=Macrobrachium rosenbergii TaxID=79674 RepID=UPI0034D4B54A